MSPDEIVRRLPDGIPLAARETIAEMARRIVERFAPERIILFGSYAHGRVGPDSDVDLLVVMRDPGTKRKMAAAIHAVLAGMGLPKDVIVITPEDLERYRDVAGTIVYPALREGKVLYERAA